MKSIRELEEEITRVNEKIQEIHIKLKDHDESQTKKLVMDMFILQRRLIALEWVRYD